MKESAVLVILSLPALHLATGPKCFEESFQSCVKDVLDDHNFFDRRHLAEGSCIFDMDVSDYMGIANITVNFCQTKIQDYQSCLSSVDTSVAENCIKCVNARAPTSFCYCYELWDLFCRVPEECCGGCSREMAEVLKCFFPPCNHDVTCAMPLDDSPLCVWGDFEECIDTCISLVIANSEAFSSMEDLVDCLIECSGPYCLVSEDRRLVSNKEKEHERILSDRNLAPTRKNTITNHPDEDIAFCQDSTQAYQACLSTLGTVEAEKCINCMNSRFPENPMYCHQLMGVLCPRSAYECACDACSHEITSAMECYYPPCTSLICAPPEPPSIQDVIKGICLRPCLVNK